ncbi:hypothetical protein A9Q84_00765 [Halobacteriovorax marinus]|uniref:Uncharacterized protein n=1 Tax=Halobacteriovorax marinus TaxID=97084 RepID=A0A1Y5FHC3_9BACT|nr:hypothetical protein A9Q84_00765 [Halobacteriovorax marinus]
MKKKKHRWILGIFYFLLLVIAVTTIRSGYYLNYGAPVGKMISTKKLTSNWTIVHVLGEGCTCSIKIFKYLSKRGLTKGASEKVIYFGKRNLHTTALEKAGFLIQLSTLEEMEINNRTLHGLPFFQIYSPDKSLKYSGGYSTSMISETTELKDLLVFEKIRNDKRNIKKNPVYACETGGEYQTQLDPFRLRYTRN